MLSILIPVYNFDIRDLVKTLRTQLKDSNISFEILCYDDCSSNVFLKNVNEQISILENVQYIKLPANIGRSKIRNLLACDAKYSYLLFMDCDSKITSENFIRNYLSHCKENLVIFGGRCYDPSPPKDSKYFRWYYGIKKEQKTAFERQKNPYYSFMSNNFLITRSLFLTIKFEENIKEYGHEDTLFGYQLYLKNIPIDHIDNALEHIGLEPANIFLQKSKQAVDSLYFIIHSKISDRKFYHSVTLLNYYLLVDKLRLKKAVSFFYNGFQLPIVHGSTLQQAGVKSDFKHII